MKKNISDLTKYDIFSGLSNDEMESILMRLNSKRISFDKDDPILLTGDPAGKAGIVLSGKVRIVMEDYYGNRSITSQVTDGEMFAEVFACSDIPHMPVSVFAAERSRILAHQPQKALRMGRSCRRSDAFKSAPHCVIQDSYAQPKNQYPIKTEYPRKASRLLFRNGKAGGKSKIYNTI